MLKITELFSEEQLSKFKERNDGSFTGECPSCGKNDNYGGSIINTKTNTFYCWGSKTVFDLLETVALLKGIISCREGRHANG